MPPKSLADLGYLLEIDDIENDKQFLLESSLTQYDSLKLIKNIKIVFIKGWYHIYVHIGEEENITIKTHKNNIRKYREASRLLAFLRTTCPNVENISIVNKEITPD